VERVVLLQVARDTLLALLLALVVPDQPLWAWAHRHLSASSAWTKVADTFLAARAFAMNQYEAATAADTVTSSA
jgi:hypothetical protein